jgi:hypothetical protein
MLAHDAIAPMKDAASDDVPGCILGKAHGTRRFGR